jgi:5-methylcytosine-specific restriction endonuclease McrA
MNVSDRRYGSLRWKRLRLAVLARDGHECQIRGANCRGTANTVNHIVPVSQGGAFFDEGNLESACGSCNFSAGAYLTRDKRRAIIEQNKYLERVVHAQQERIIALENQLARHTNGAETEPARPRAKPAIR